MAYVKGRLPKDKVEAFLKFMADNGYGHIPGKSQWELAQVMVGGRFRPITVDSKSVVGIPDILMPQLARFFEAIANVPKEHPDTVRLDFMLTGPSRHIVKEVVGYNGRGESLYELYVAEGPFADSKFPSVHITGSGFDWVDGDHGDLYRQVIDLAIHYKNAPRSVPWE